MQIQPINCFSNNYTFSASKDSSNPQIKFQSLDRDTLNFKREIEFSDQTLDHKKGDRNYDFNISGCEVLGDSKVLSDAFFARSATVKNSKFLCGLYCIKNADLDNCEIPVLQAQNIDINDTTAGSIFSKPAKEGNAVNLKGSVVDFFSFSNNTSQVPGATCDLTISNGTKITTLTSDAPCNVTITDSSVGKISAMSNGNLHIKNSRINTISIDTETNVILENATVLSDFVCPSRKLTLKGKNMLNSLSIVSPLNDIIIPSGTTVTGNIYTFGPGKGRILFEKGAKIYGKVLKLSETPIG